MNIHLDLTELLSGAVDYENGGGLKTYLDIGMTEDLCSTFDFFIENFVLNLDDPLIQSIARQDEAFARGKDEEGFLIVRRAHVSIAEVKGCDAKLILPTDDRDIVTYKTWNYRLSEGDCMYDMGGWWASFPQLWINLKIVSNGAVSLQFSTSECLYIETYQKLLVVSKSLNEERGQVAAPKGRLFDPAFRTEYLESDFDGRVWVKKGEGGSE